MHQGVDSVIVYNILNVTCDFLGFLMRLSSKIIQYAKIVIARVCLIPLMFTGTLRRYFTTTCRLVFKQLPQDLANVNV